MDLKELLLSIRPQLAEAAQYIYDSWEQDENGYCEYHDNGGICGSVAEALRACVELYTDFSRINIYHISRRDKKTDIGHEWIIVEDTEDCVSYNIDIPWEKYEEYEGIRLYAWNKKENVKLSAKDVRIWKNRIALHFGDRYEYRFAIHDTASFAPLQLDLYDWRYIMKIA